LLNIVLVFFLVLSAIPALSQGSMKILHDKRKQKLSFEYINNVIIIPLTLNGKKLSFILDTGARNTILFGSTNSDSLVLNDQIKTKLKGIGGGKSINAIISRNNRIKIKNIYGYNQKIYVLLNDNFDMSLKMGRPIHGIIGYELLKNFVTSIDYLNRRLRFYDPKRYTPPKSKRYQKFDLSFHHDKPYIETNTQLNDSLTYKTKLLIDTGCSDALWLFEDEKRGFNVQGVFFDDYLGEGLSGGITGKRSRIKSFSIGKYKFNEITSAFLDSASTLHARVYRERDGSIGSGLLERFKLILDYPNKKIYLKKVMNLKKEFRYNRSGLGVAYHKDARVLYAEKKNKITISENQEGVDSQLFEITYQYKLKRLFYIYYVRKDSPAEKAGLKANDIIYKINGKAFFDYNLNEIINLFYGDNGKKIYMNIERNGYPMYFEFRLKNPLSSN